MRAMTLVEPLARPQVPAPTKISVPCRRAWHSPCARRVFAQASSLWQIGPFGQQLDQVATRVARRCVQRSQHGRNQITCSHGSLPFTASSSKAVELFHVEMAVEFAVQLDDRRDGAGPEASHRDDGELVVRRVAAWLEIQLARQVLRQLQALLHVAGRAPTHLDDVRALRGEAELVVEGRHAVDAALRNADGIRNLVHGGLGYVTFLGLNLLQDRDEVLFAKLLMARDDLIDVTHTTYLGCCTDSGKKWLNLERIG
jgi:hypothetical protein